MHVREDARTVLVIGGGGRDHALCFALAQSPRCGELHAAPGNAGIAALATCHSHVELDDADAMLDVARAIDADLVVIGAEDLLVAGLADRFLDAGFACVGPTAAAARLEGSKTFSKQLMERAGIPTPPWASCTDVASAHAAIDEFGGAVAIKADGLAAGCGAVVCPTRELAHAAVHEMLVEQRFGASGSRIIVEQLVDGEEASVMALVDGDNVLPLPAARDYKRLEDGGDGPNTGGMGAHAPSVDVDATEAARLARATITPIITQMRADGTPFRGVVYAGVMLTSDGPQVLEYNCRFGNPETQALVRVLDADLLDLLERTAHGSLDGLDDIQANGAAVAVCIAAENYPELQLEPAPVTVRGLDAARQVEGVELFIGLADAGETSDVLHALGGRVVTVSAWAATHAEAAGRAYAAAAHIDVPNQRMRTDIGIGVLAPAGSQS